MRRTLKQQINEILDQISIVDEQIAIILREPSLHQEDYELLDSLQRERRNYEALYDYFMSFMINKNPVPTCGCCGEILSMNGGCCDADCPC